MSDETVEDWVKGLDDITTSMRDVSRLQTGIIKGFTEITKTNTATGQAWVSIARFFSGTGFWKIQNKIKSVSNMLQAAQKLEEKRLKQEGEMLEQIVKRENALKNIRRTKIALENLNNNAAAHEEFKLIYSSKYFKMLQMTLGTTGALMAMRTRMEKMEAKALKSKKESNHSLIKQLKHMIKLGDEQRISQKDFARLTKQEQGDIAYLLSLEKERDLLLENRATATTDEDKKEIDEQLKFVEDEANTTAKRLSDSGVDLKTSLKGGKASLTGVELSDDERAERDKNPFVKQFDKLKGALGDLRVSGMPSDNKYAMRSMGLGKPLSKFEKRMWKWIGRKKKFDAFMHRLGKVQWTAIKTYTTAARAVGGFMLKKSKIIGSFLSKGLMLFAQAMMFITLAVMGFFLLKKLGVFRWLQDTWEALIGWLGGVFEWVGQIWEGVAEFIDAIAVLFNDFSIENLVNAFVALVDLIGVIVVGFWTQVVWPLIWDVLFMPIWNWLNDFLDLDWKDKFWSSALKLVLAIIVIIIVIKLVLIAMPVLIAALPFIFAGIIVIAIAKAIGEALGFWSTGGVIDKPLQMVGEKGPELVSLPKGTRVHSNTETRGMVNGGTTNITVNVQGRIGASDAEVRDMATKVSKIISREINRSTSSGTRG